MSVLTPELEYKLGMAVERMPAKITLVGRSVIYLGINTIKNLALGFAAVGMLPRMNAEGFDTQRRFRR